MKETFFQKGAQDTHEIKGSLAARKDIRNQDKKSEEQERMPLIAKREIYLGDKEVPCLNHPYCKSPTPIKPKESAVSIYKDTNGKKVLLGRTHSSECADSAAKKLRRERKFQS